MKVEKKKKRSQQEIVGFVLIVGLVMVALMVFIVISLRKPAKMKESVEVENLLSAVMKHTTECAIVYEPDYDSIQDLIKSCYDNEKCSNLNKMACDYMNETFVNIMDALMQTESQVSAYQLDINYEDSEGIEARNMLTLYKGNCSGGTVAGAQELISVETGKILIRLRFCYE